MRIGLMTKNELIANIEIAASRMGILLDDYDLGNTRIASLRIALRLILQGRGGNLSRVLKPKGPARKDPNT